jgi:hypothetical protein
MENKNRDSKELPDCCKPVEKYKGNSLLIGIFYGLVPHIGCILFVIAAVLGSTILLQVFKPFLLNRNIFYYLILISAGFATLSSFLYLRKNKRLSWQGIRASKKYLSVMYGTTIGINVLFFFFVFPMIANITGRVSDENSAGLNSLALKVDIPCSGHASLIINELKTIEGVEGSEFSFPNNFDVKYDSSRTSKQEILSLEVFKTYKASVTSESASQASRQINQKGSCGGSCCGGAG